MKATFVKKRLEEMKRDAEWLADQCGVAPVTMRQNYLRGITPQKPVAINIKRLLKCRYSDFLHEEEMEALSLADEKAS
jgi:hypothetical protein